MPTERDVPTRREFLERLARAGVYAAPLFVTLGARPEEQSAFERANRYLGSAEDLVARARKVEDDARRELATEAQTELTEAKRAARDASRAEQAKLQKAFDAVDQDIKELLDE